MSRKGENIYKRKDGRWEGRYIIGHNNSKIIYGYIYGKSYKEVREKLIQKKALPNQNSDDESNLTQPFSAYAKLWLSEKKSIVKYSTYIKYCNLLDGYIIPGIGNETIEKIGYDKISDFCIKLLQSGRKNKSELSPKTTSDCLTLIKSIIRFAARKNVILILQYLR